MRNVPRPPHRRFQIPSPFGGFLSFPKLLLNKNFFHFELKWFFPPLRKFIEHKTSVGEDILFCGRNRQTGFFRIYAHIYTNFTCNMRMRIYAILENVRIAYIYFLRLPIRSTRVYTQTAFLRIYAHIYTNFTYKMRMRIYAILGNMRIAYIFYQFFAYGQTQYISTFLRMPVPVITRFR